MNRHPPRFELATGRLLFGPPEPDTDADEVEPNEDDDPHEADLDPYLASNAWAPARRPTRKAPER